MELQITVRNEEDLDKFFKEIIKEITHTIFNKSQENIIKQGISDTGFLLRSGVVEDNKITYSAPYADFIEYGTDPHWVNPNILVGWVKRKLRVKDRDAIDVAYAIAYKISKEGTDAQPFLRPAIKEVKIKYA